MYNNVVTNSLNENIATFASACDAFDYAKTQSGKYRTTLIVIISNTDGGKFTAKYYDGVLIAKPFA